MKPLTFELIPGKQQSRIWNVFDAAHDFMGCISERSRGAQLVFKSASLHSGCSLEELSEIVKFMRSAPTEAQLSAAYHGQSTSEPCLVSNSRIKLIRTKP